MSRPWGPACGIGTTASDADRIAGFDDDDLRRIRDVHVKRIGHGIVDGPPRSARHGNIREVLPGVKVHDRDRVRAANGGVTDVGDQEPPASRIVGEPIGPHADGDLVDGGPTIGTEESDRVLTPVRRDDELQLGRDEGAGHPCQVFNRAEVRPCPAVDDVDRVVCGVGHVDAARGLVDGGMVEPAGLGMRGQLDEPQPPERHVIAPQPGPRPAARRSPRCGHGPLE